MKIDFSRMKERKKWCSVFVWIYDNGSNFFVLFLFQGTPIFVVQLVFRCLLLREIVFVSVSFSQYFYVLR